MGLIKSLHVLFWWILLTMLMSCATGERGRIVPDAEVDNLFAQATVLPDHAYYYYGPFHSPVAIIALQESLELESRLWTSVADPQRQLAVLIDNTRNQRNLMCTFDGARIIAPDGKAIGYWYAKWHLSSVRPADNGAIRIFPPAEPTSGPCKPEGFKRN